MSNEEKLSIAQFCKQTGQSPLVVAARLRHLRSKKVQLPKVS